MKLLPKILPRDDTQARAEAYRNVMRHEAKLGGQLFGPIPDGRRREFFCLDRYTWVWHEEWKDSEGRRQVVSTHYIIRPDGVLKSQNNHGYRRLGRQELIHLYQAIGLYRQRVTADLAAMRQTA